VAGTPNTAPLHGQLNRCLRLKGQFDQDPEGEGEATRSSDGVLQRLLLRRLHQVVVRVQATLPTRGAASKVTVTSI
jgi:hypothetical protein